MSIAPPLVPQPASRTIPPPLLEQGDHLTRDEFERRYAALSQVKKAELIEGVVYMPSPVRLDEHAGPHADLMWWLGHYRVYTPGVRVGDNATIRLDLENEPQPDAVLFVEPDSGGRVQIIKGYIEGAPDLVAEVAASTVSIDLNTKFRVYRRSQVREYLVWRVQDEALDWFLLRDGDFARLEADTAGVVRSQTFPGLWLDTAALLRSDLAAVLQVLQQGLSSGDHAEFESRLRPSP